MKKIIIQEEEIVFLIYLKKRIILNTTSGQLPKPRTKPGFEPQQDLNTRLNGPQALPIITPFRIRHYLVKNRNIYLSIDVIIVKLFTFAFLFS